MKRKLIIIIASGLVILSIIFGIFKYLSFSQSERIALLEEKISLLKVENTPVKFKILSKNNGKIKVAVKFYDSQSTPVTINRFVETFEGNELSFDFLVLQVKDTKLIFPYKVYTDKIAPDKGMNITEQYNKSGFPQVFYYEGIDPELKMLLSEVFTKIKSEDLEADDDYFGSMIHDISGFKEYKVGTIYKIVAHTKGGIEVMEDNSKN